jgi:hypothetical protein
MTSCTGSTFYCHICADGLGLFEGLHLTSINPSSYQTAKAVKHTGVTLSSTGINSVLNSGSTAEYDDLSRKALAHGFVEVEANGCRSVIYQSNRHIGTRHEAGVASAQLDSFRWVLSSASSLAHGRPDSSTSYSSAACAACGSLVIS